MARRRMVDPNFWSSEDVAKLTIRQRLLLIGLFSNADDHGKGKGKATYIRSIVFPYDDISIGEITEDLNEIERVISVKFYEVDGNSYYMFLNWTKWQRVDKPQKTIIPDPIGECSDNDSWNDSENENGIDTESFLPKGKEKKRSERKEKKEYSPSVFLTEVEYSKLVKKYNDEQTLKKWLDFLSNRILANGYKYKSHYQVMLGWVHETFEKQSTPSITNDDHFKQRQSAMQLALNYVGEPRTD